MTDAIGTLTKRVLFSPLKEPGRTEAVVDRIRAAIMLGIFADGEQLPKEIDLAGELHVSPVTLRDALRVIRLEGLARTTRGRSGGTFVIAPDESNMSRFEQKLTAVSALKLRDLFDWQSAVNGHSAYLAAERASRREIDMLMEMLGQLEQASEAPIARRALSRLLIEISAIGRSARLARENITLQIEVAPHAMLILRRLEVRGHGADLGRNLVEAIRDQDAHCASSRSVEFTGYIGSCIMELRHELTHSTSVPRREKDDRASKW